MEKLMPLDLLSSIEGAEASEAVSKLFEVIKNAVPDSAVNDMEAVEGEAVAVDQLRSDEAVPCSESEKSIIRNNFPESRKGYLVVPKVIEE